MDVATLTVETGGAFRCVDLTARIARWVDGRGDGLCTVFVPHATAGVAVFETGSGTEEDLERALDALLPRDDRWTHRHGSAGHGRDHVMPAFVPSSLTVPVTGGQMMLGTWQSIVLVDPNPDNPERSVHLAFLAGG